MYYSDENTKGYKKVGIILTIISSVWLCIIIGTAIIANYEYSKNYKSYWNLADKASTIPQKSIYVDQFVQRLETSGLNGKYDAIFLETPDNSFDKNLEALKTLQTRLQEIQLMDPKSFEYNTAISQITAQEQGEANAMLSVFKGVWFKSNHIMIWDWVCGISVVSFIVVLCLGIRYWNYGNWDWI
jgi:hypothetical protein